MVLADYGFGPGEGLYTDMNAIRPDEECLDNLHSVYVDQWDWERVIREQERNLDFLKAIVRSIYAVLRMTERAVHDRYPQIVPMLPEEITLRPCGGAARAVARRRAAGAGEPDRERTRGGLRDRHRRRAGRRHDS